MQRRGQTRSALGDMEGALSDLCKAIELDPSDVDGHQQRGLTLHKMRDFRRALTDLRHDNTCRQTWPWRVMLLLTLV